MSQLDDSEELPGMQQFLTRQQIAEQLGTTDAKIRRYAEADTTNEYFKGITGRGKGVRYPFDSIPLFAEAMKLTPALFRELIVDALASRRTDGAATSDNLPAVRSHNGSMSQYGALDEQRLIESIEAGVERIVIRLRDYERNDSMRQIGAQSVQVAEVRIVNLTEKLLTLKEAREETGLTIAEIRALPSVQNTTGSRRRWKRSVLQRHIESMEDR